MPKFSLYFLFELTTVIALLCGYFVFGSQELDFFATFDQLPPSDAKLIERLERELKVSPIQVTREEKRIQVHFRSHGFAFAPPPTIRPDWTELGYVGLGGFGMSYHNKAYFPNWLVLLGILLISGVPRLFASLRQKKEKRPHGSEEEK